MTHKQRANKILAQLIEQRVLSNSTIVNPKGLARKTSTSGSESQVFYGKYKDVCTFLEGVEYISMISLPINQ